MPGGGARRRLGLVLLGAGLVAGAAFGFWYVLQSIDQRQPYVVAARDIARMDTVSASDFRLVEASVGDASAMTASQMGAVYGQWAAGVIPAGTFVTPGMFQPVPMSGADEARSIVIQVSLPAEDVSYGALEVGDTVALIGRERPPGSDQGFDTGFDPPETELSLIGVLHIEDMRDGSIVYVVEPSQALQIQGLVRRYLGSTERQIWRLGAELTVDDVQRALDERADLVNNG